MATTIRPGDTVTVSYSDPTADDDEYAIQDTGGADARSFTDFPVTNNSRAYPADCQTGDLWCATMTVGELFSGATLLGRGFHEAASVGALTDSDFTLGGTDYSVIQLLLSVGGNQLTVRFDPNGQNVFNSDAYTLVLDGTAYSFGDAAFDSITNQFRILDNNLTWADGQSVSVRLISTGAPGETLNQIEGDAPRVTAIEADSPADGSWDAGDTLTLTVRFSQAVEVDATDGTPTLAALVGTTPVTASWTGGSGTDALTFSVELPAGTASADTLLVSANALSLNGGTIQSAGETPADLAHIAYGFSGAVSAARAAGRGGGRRAAHGVARP